MGVQVHQLGRELLSERTKVKALSEELENPLNVHRWVPYLKVLLRARAHVPPIQGFRFPDPGLRRLHGRSSTLHS